MFIGLISLGVNPCMIGGWKRLVARGRVLSSCDPRSVGLDAGRHGTTSASVTWPVLLRVTRIGRALARQRALTARATIRQDAGPIVRAVSTRLQMPAPRGDGVRKMPGAPRVRDGSQCTGV